MNDDHAASALGELADHLTDILDQCRTEFGMSLPFIVTAVSPNGCVSVMRLHGVGKYSETLASHYEGGGFKFPIGVFVIDQGGSGARVTIEKHRVEYH